MVVSVDFVSSLDDTLQHFDEIWIMSITLVQIKNKMVASVDFVSTLDDTLHHFDEIWNIFRTLVQIKVYQDFLTGSK